jgi:DNA invertase Pin-like site-specific DNA recombinase
MTARVSTDDQNPALQTAALKKAGCKKIFKDRDVSGVIAKRPGCARKGRDGAQIIM